MSPPPGTVTRRNYRTGPVRPDEGDTAAKHELNQLEKTTATTARQTEAKLQAAELTGQEGTEL